MSQNASPPTPVMCGYTTLRTALAAMAASTAEPPALRTSVPASEASACGPATIPRNASVAGRPVVRAAAPSGERLLRVRQADRLADLGELAGVIVPVIVEHRADEHRNRDLVGAHELLEQRDARLAPEVGVAQAVEVSVQIAALGVEPVHQLLDIHLLPLGRHVRVAGLHVDERQVPLSERLEQRARLEAGLEQQMTQDLARRPLPRRIGALEIGPETLGLTTEIRPRRVGLLP